MRKRVLAVISSMLIATAARSAEPLELTNSVAVDRLTVSYPDGWSTLKSGRVTMILEAPADRQAALGDQFVFTPQVSVSTEQRLDDKDALEQLEEIAAGAGPSVTRLTIGGWPAIQWRGIVPWPPTEGQPPAVGKALTINTVVAAGTLLVRLYGSLPSDKSSEIAATITAIESSLASAEPSSSVTPFSTPTSRRTAKPAKRKKVARPLRARLTAPVEFELEGPPSVGSESASQPAEPGAALRILQ